MATFYPVPPLVLKTELPPEFYCLPNLYPANFSTKYGFLPKKGLDYPLATTIAHADFNADVSAMAAELQRAWPEQIWELSKKPNRWEDLLVWFDPYDIHILGAVFLLQVLYRIQERNEQASAGMNAIIDEAAFDWVARNEAVVSNLRPDQDVLQLVESDETLGMKDREMVMFSIALDKHRHLLHARLLAERSGSFVVPIPFAGPMVHGAPSLHPAYVPHLAVNQAMVGATHVLPAVQQTRTTERLVNELRLSAASQVNNSAAYPPRKDNYQRNHENHSAPNGIPQARRFSQSHAQQGKPQPRRMSTTKRVRPRGYSTISVRNDIDGPLPSVQRRASNPGTLPPTFVSILQSNPKGSGKASAAYRSPRENQLLVDPTVIAQSPPRPQALVDPAIIAQSPPRQQPIVDPSIIAQGPKRTPQTSPSLVRRIQNDSKYSRAQDRYNIPHAVHPTMRHISQDARVFSPLSMHNPSSVVSLVNGLPSMSQGFRAASSHILPTASPRKYPTLSQDARIISAFARSTSQQFPLSRGPVHNGHFSQQEHNGHRIPSTSSSASTHNVRSDRYEFMGNRNSSLGSRRMISQQVGNVSIKEWRKVVTFNGKSQNEADDPGSTHSMYLRYIKEEFFDSMVFRQILDECGEVYSMTYQKSKTGGPRASGQAFVRFASVDSVKNGIARLNCYRSSDGQTIEASQALPRRDSSYGHKEHSSNPKRVTSNASSRRPSIYTQSQAYEPHQYSNQQSRAPSPAHREPLTDGFQRQLLSATLQLEHNQFNTQITGTPLEDISNSQKNPDLKTRYPMPSKENLPSKPNFQTPLGSPKKENVPFLHNTKTTSATPRNLTPHGTQNEENGQKQAVKKKGKRGGRKTAESSAQPTPNTSPRKLESMVDLANVAKGVTKKPFQLDVATNTPETEPASHTQVNKLVQGQLETQKQQEMLSAGHKSSGSTAGTSFTNSLLNTAPSSRGAGSLSLSSAGVSDDPNPKIEDAKDASIETSMSTPTKKPTKSKKKRASKVNIALPDPLLANIEPVGTKSTANELNVKKVADQRTGESSDAHAGALKSRKNSKHARKESANHDSVRKADSNLTTAKPESSDGPSKAQAKKGPEKKEGSDASVNSKSHSKKAGEKKTVKDSVLPTGQIEKTFDKPPNVTAPNSENGDQISTDEYLKLSCDEQFPALEPANSPASTIADGKRPAAPKSIRGAPPAMGHFNQIHRTQSSQSLKNQTQAQSKPAVPVPRISMPGKKPQCLVEQSVLDGGCIDTSPSWSEVMSDSRVASPINIDSLGSITWPFVRSFRRVDGNQAH